MNKHNLTSKSVRHLREVRHGHRGQDGFLLMSVIAILLVLSLVGMALLAYVMSGIMLTRTSIEKANRIRDIDAALEETLHLVREDADLCADVNFSITHRDIEVECAGQVVTPSQGQDIRIVNLSAERAGQDVGWATVRIVDLVSEVGTPLEPEYQRIVTQGYSLEVCDWQLGTERAALPLQGCAP